MLSVVRADRYEDAIKLANDHEIGQWRRDLQPVTATPRVISPLASRSAWSASNVPIPVPIAYYTFGGWKASAFGDLNQHGPDAFRFYTKTKTVTSRWPSGIKDGADFVIPTMN